MIVGALIHGINDEVAFLLGIVQPYTGAATAHGEVTLLVLAPAAFEEALAVFPEQAR
jgi:hypothetical protein